MMKTLALIDIAEATDGQAHLSGVAECEFSRVNTDTRSLKEGDLFVALKGERFDAHDFLQDVAQKKAAAAVVDRFIEGVKLPQLVVKNTTKALGDIAMYNRDLFSGSLVGITGSCGKTTVKAMLKNIFEQASSQEAVLATEGNFNNHIGVPLTLFNLNPQHQYAVVEMGASGAGEIKYLSAMSKPDVVVVTNALQAHVEGFGSLAGIAKAKGELFEFLKDDGVAVINRDDPAFDQWISLLENNTSKNLKVITFSASDSVRTSDRNNYLDFNAIGVSEGPKGNVEFVMNIPGDEVVVRLQLLGKQNVSNALAAAACAFSVGIDAENIKKGLENTIAVPGRMCPISGINNSLIIDDSYNANPDSVKAAIDALSQWTSNTFLVLGDLGELGEKEEQLHADLGEYAKRKNIQHLLTVGELTKATSLSFGEKAVHCKNQEELIKMISAMLDDKSVVLVKGSRVSKMDKVVAALKDGGEN
ncbi:MAG: UDP-N-acetylmuramoyl-tripeptide--D-alanyl-D-alanine ligase [Cellvibrionaceae bacterium]